MSDVLFLEYEIVVSCAFDYFAVSLPVECELDSVGVLNVCCKGEAVFLRCAEAYVSFERFFFNNCVGIDNCYVGYLSEYLLPYFVRGLLALLESVEEEEQLFLEECPAVAAVFPCY